jgi:hypothetical protein
MSDGEDFGLRDAFGSRLKSAFFGGFVISWLVLHWRLPYVTLFISGEHLGTVKGAEHIGSKLDYVIDHLHHHCGWCHWLGPAFVALLAPWLIHLVDKGIEYVKGCISAGWAWVGQKRDPKSFVTYEQFAHLAKRIKVLEEELRDAQLSAVNAQSEEAKAKNELAAEKKAKADLEASLGDLPYKAGQFDKLVNRMPDFEQRFGGIRTQVGNSYGAVNAMKVMGTIEHELRDLTTVHGQAHIVVGVASK